MTHVTEMDRLLTMAELLAALKNQYSRRTVYAWVKLGMPHSRIRGKLWFPKDEVFQWLKSKN